ncbi:hypothetical protein CF160_12700 [Enterococcus pseudoavium]|nr:hypothetical protein CF160_12700 [Enterococcus pseudoavium]
MLSPIILAVLIFCNFIMAFTSSLAAKPHNYVIIENTFPADKINDPKVLAFRQAYRKRQFQLAWGLTLLDLTLLIPMKDPIFMILFFVLLFITLGAGYLLQIRYIRKGHQLIVENDWQLTPQPVQVDTKLVLAKNRKLVSPWWFGLAFVLLLLLNLFQLANFTWLLFAICGFSLVLFILGWWAIQRLPVKALTNDAQINQQSNDLTKFYWSAFMVVSSFFVILIVYIPMLTMNISDRFFAFMMVVEFALIFFFCGATFYWLLRLRQKQDQLLSQTPSFRYAGDDYYWRYGLYCNPADHRLMLPDRIGMNLTVNLGRTGGKILMALLPVVLIGAMIVTVVPLYILDYHPNPLTYEAKQTTLRLDGPLTKASEIPYAEMKNVALINQMPAAGMKVSGLATNNYAIGSFKVEGQPATLFVDYQSQPILKISTKTRDYYYTNKDAAKTKQLYQKVLAHQ